MPIMNTVLVTGCAGFIGSHLVERLLKENIKVIGIDNFHPYYAKKLKELNLKQIIENPDFTFIPGSILLDMDLEKISDKIDCVFHFAAIAGVRNSFEHPDEYFEINLKGTEKLLNKFSRVEKFVFASSSSVYGNLLSSEFPVKEDHSLNPISPYGESKKQAENLCLNFSNEFNVKVAILRIHTVYGPRQRPDEAISKFVKLADLGEPIPVFGDGTKKRDYTNVSDIVDCAILAAEKGIGVYNLGTGYPVSLNEMVFTIEKVMNIRTRRNVLTSPKGDVEKTHADISKAKKELGYIPKIPFEMGIRQYVKWYYDSK